MRAVRGVNGGYRLARPANEISLWDISEAIESGAPDFQCEEIRRKGSCSQFGAAARTCAVAAAFWAAERAYQQSLQLVSVAHIAKGVANLYGSEGTGAIPDLDKRGARACRESTMKLMYQTHSPFARKVLVFAYEVGLAEQIEVAHLETSPTVRNDAVFEQNPLGKVPVLIRPSLTLLFDSDVILGVSRYLTQRSKTDSCRWQGTLADTAVTGSCSRSCRIRDCRSLGVGAPASGVAISCIARGLCS